MDTRVQLRAQRIVILAEGSFGVLESKTATVLVRYLTDNVVAVIDSANVGKDVSEVLEIGEGIPVVASLVGIHEIPTNNVGNRYLPSGWKVASSVERCVVRSD